METAMKILLTLAALAAASTAAPALAQAPTAEVVVSYADLDLSSPAGQRALDRRLVHAVREACGDASDADLHGKNLVRSCRTDTARVLERQRAEAFASTRRGSAERLASGR
jgi:UrcA family protein